jgi:NodT family efflux transporter outer membrane factor (OMF) lipoprotein
MSPATLPTATLACALSMALTLTGCKVGPNYRGPPVMPAPATFHRADDATTPGEAPAQWWTAFNDPELNRLIDAAVAGSPNVEVAKARVREARASLRGKHADVLPSTGADAAVLRTKNFTSLLGGGGGGSLDLYALGFDATWEIDLFGAKARATEGAAAAAGASQADLANLYVTLTADVARAYIELRDAQQRLALTQREVDIDAKLLELTRIRETGGTASDLDVERMTGQLDSTRANLAPLQASVAQWLDRLAVLTGQSPGALDEELAAVLPTPVPPEKVAIADPSALLRRRPDIAVAERKLAQQTAAIGQNIAALFPKVNLLGEVGFASLSPGTLLNGSSFSYVVAPILQWTPWDFGRTRAKIDQARAARDEAEANYRETVLAALEDAEESLSQYGQQRQSVIDLAGVRDSAQRAGALTQIRLQGGRAANIDVLEADSRRIEAELNFQRSVAQLSEDYVALQKSLGLAWVSPADGVR